jgi:uncharacterized protein YndB with AHSA1/START domain
MIHVAAAAHANAPAETVWAILADTENWPRWSRNDTAVLERPGVTVRDGVGAIRRLHTGRIRVREEITAFDPPTRLGYRLLSGLPVRDYEATVTLSPGDGGTAIEWAARFGSAVPGLGWLLRRSLHRVLDDFATALAAAASGAVDRVDAADAR